MDSQEKDDIIMLLTTDAEIKESLIVGYIQAIDARDNKIVELKKELYKLKMEYRNIKSENKEADKIILAGIDRISALEKASREKLKPWLKQ